MLGALVRFIIHPSAFIIYLAFREPARITLWAQAARASLFIDHGGLPQGHDVAAFGVHTNIR